MLVTNLRRVNALRGKELSIRRSQEALIDIRGIFRDRNAW